jgi:hypothetical protein
MSSQTLMWTALPNGWNTTQTNALNLCVYLSPRLITEAGHDGHLEPDFPDFIDWPKTVSSIAFKVSFGGGAPITVAADHAVLQSTLWTALFKSGTRVRSHRFQEEFAKRRIRSYPVGEVHKTVRKVHQAMIRRSGAERPSLQDLGLAVGRDAAAPGRPEGPIANLLPLATNAAIDEQLEGVMGLLYGTGRAVTVAQVNNYATQVAFRPDQIEAKAAQLNFYQLRKFHEFSPKEGANKIPVPPPQPDFHEVLSSLARFPKLLRPLGLAFDLVVPMSANVPFHSDVRVVPTDLTLRVTSQHPSPRTRYRIDQGARLFVTASDGSEVVDGVLQPGVSEYNVVQVDVDGAALKLAALASNVVLMETAGKTSIDTPTDAGIPAPRTSGFSVACTDRAQRLADTLTKGKQQNDSLGTDPQADKLFLTADDVTRGFVIDVHDSVTGAWHSLCGRHGLYKFLDINQSRTFDDEGLVSLNVTEPTDGSPDLKHHESLFHWQGWSLAVARPGQVVDKDSKPGTGAHPAGPDYRMETTFLPRKDLPLPRLRYGWSYQFRLRAVDLAGNGLPIDTPTDPAANLPLTLVSYLRYDPIAAPFVLARDDLTDANKHPGESFERLVIRSNYNTPFEGPADRHIAPPKASQLLAETHGKFDDPHTGKLDPNAYDRIIASDKSFDKDAQTEQAQPHPEAQLTIPYLPDPLARGAALLFTDGPPLNTVPKVEFDGAWPDNKPFRISLVEGGGAPSFDAAQRVLTVPLRKAEQATLRLSSHLDEADLGLMGAWQDGLLDPPADFDVQKATEQAIAGRLWTLTPFRELKLVHAVQQPLLEPKFQRLSVTRGLGATFAWIADEFPIDGKSTIKVALEADWQEPVDDGASDDAPIIQSAGAKPFEIQQVIGNDVAALSGRHEFHDTKYRKVNYQAVATTRFREYFRADIIKDQNNITRRSAAVAIDVPNAAPPPAPKILYVVPTFIWENSADPAWQTRKRRGGGLRVYLDRPWYSSGEGELLGVVLWNCAPPRQDASEGITLFPLRLIPTTPQVPDHLVPYATQWAMDPIFDGRPTPTQTTPYFEHFRNTVATEVDLPLLETGEFTVAVAGHAVKFDGVNEKHVGRKLWYCDIDMDPGDAYFPFIRLALARFQPKSVRGAHLSRVVLADFAQLTADRSASISFDGADPLALTVAVCGVAPMDQASVPASRVTATIQLKSVDAAGRTIWFPSSEAELHRAAAEEGFAPRLWRASLTLPAPRGSKPMRLIIKEYEHLHVDAGDRSNIMAVGSAERLVYADAIDI